MTVDVSKVEVFSHSNIKIQGTTTSEGVNRPVTLYFDVFEMPTEPHDAGILFITHDHFDHYSFEDAKKVVNESTIIVTPESLIEKSAQAEKDPSAIETEPGEPAFEPVSKLNAARIISVKPGDTLTIDGVAVEVVPAYNTRPDRLGFHPKENKWVGYVVTVDGVRYYVTGDTDQNPDNETISCDVMLVPVGGTFTCDPQEAAAFVNTVKPKVAIPTHYGSITGNTTDGDEFINLVDAGICTVKKLPYR